jgi:hypothetical protein
MERTVLRPRVTTLLTAEYDVRHRHFRCNGMSEAMASPSRPHSERLKTDGTKQLVGHGSRRVRSVGRVWCRRFRDQGGCNRYVV